MLDDAAEGMDAKVLALTTFMGPPILPQSGEQDVAVLQNVAQNNRVTERTANFATYLCHPLAHESKMLISGLFYQEKVRADGCSIRHGRFKSPQVIHQAARNVKHWARTGASRRNLLFVRFIAIMRKISDDLEPMIQQMTRTPTDL